jgi:hypothetical protein
LCHERRASRFNPAIDDRLVLAHQSIVELIAASLPFGANTYPEVGARYFSTSLLSVTLITKARLIRRYPTTPLILTT